MKKAVLYLTCLSTLAISSAMAGNTNKEEEDMVLVQEKFFDKTLSEARQSTKLAEDLAGELAEMKKRVAELEGQLSTSSPVPAPDDSAPSLSGYQQQLLSQWEAGRIGVEAWSALGGDHVSLARAVYTALVSNIQENPGKDVEMFFIDINNFKLKIGGKLQGKIYKF